MTSLNDIRSQFLGYFGRNEHEVQESSPLVQRSETSQFFTESGMEYFKSGIKSADHRDSKRVATSQKCLRVEGGQNDLDKVGLTARHLSFFEMLSAFTLGECDKENAISLLWALITEELGISSDKLVVTLDPSDTETAMLWEKIAGLPNTSIIRMATDVHSGGVSRAGPFGTGSQIFYDHGDHLWGGPPGTAEKDGDRFIDIAKLGFLQNECRANGSVRPLDKEIIGVGMGLERVASLLQGTNNVFENDHMRALVEASADATSTGVDDDLVVHHRVIADHLRAMAFLLVEGILPANEGHGYVLRRILRRAMRHVHLLGAEHPTLHRLVPALVDQIGKAYPELEHAQARIEETILHEETDFKSALDCGLKLLDATLGGLSDGATFPGEIALQLLDSHGFPLDLTQDALRAQGRQVDMVGFDQAVVHRQGYLGSG